MRFDGDALSQGIIHATPILSFRLAEKKERASRVQERKAARGARTNIAPRTPRVSGFRQRYRETAGRWTGWAPGQSCRLRWFVEDFRIEYLNICSYQRQRS